MDVKVPNIWGVTNTLWIPMHTFQEILTLQDRRERR